MSGYLVRLESTKKLIGMVTVTHKRELYDLLNQFCPPEDCEILAAGNAALMKIDFESTRAIFDPATEVKRSINHKWQPFDSSWRN